MFVIVNGTRYVKVPHFRYRRTSQFYSVKAAA